MKGLSQKEKDIQEIFHHVKKIREEQEFDSKDKKLESVDIIKYSADGIAGELSEDNFSDEDVFEIVEPVVETQDELEDPVSKMTLDFGSAGVCDICSGKIVFEKNLAGLVINDKFFACENCCQKATKNDLDSWVETKNAKTENVRPIAFWLMQIKNKNKLL
jgi:hypothetical protein